MFKNLKEAFSYLESFANFEKKAFNLRFVRLDRMERLLEFFGNPHRAFRSIHVAGSKGKGSTATFLASVLREAGFRTGLYTSPHLVSYKERITLAGEEIEDELFLRFTGEIKKLLDRLDPRDFPSGEYPTTFELLTCLGFLIFRDLGCSWAVLETGMGGRLDATNVVLPAASVLTPIELEHTEYLGETVAAIAGEKAGIIKPGVPVFVSPQPEEALAVFREHAAQKGCDFFSFIEELPGLSCRTTRTATYLSFTRRDGTTLRASLRLLGEVQAENAALAALTLGKIFPELAEESLIRGLETAYISGRFERLEEQPAVYIDGSHTPYSVTRLIHSFQEIHPEPDTLILGIVAGKRYREMAEILCPRFRRTIVTTPGTFKASNPEEVWEACKKISPAALLIPSPEAALVEAKRGLASSDGPILVTGSFYLAGEILKLYEKEQP